MAFWNEQSDGAYGKYWHAHDITHNINTPKTINKNFEETELMDLATEGQQLWSGIAKVSDVSVERFDYGPHGDYSCWLTTVKLELNGKNGVESHTLVYDGSEADKIFKKDSNISFTGTKEGKQLHLIMIGEPADLEAIQTKVKDAIENGKLLIKMNKLKDQIKSAGKFLIGPLKEIFLELKAVWEGKKTERELREERRIQEEKLQREKNNNRPTGYYSQPEEQSRNGNISK